MYFTGYWKAKINKQILSLFCATFSDYVVPLLPLFFRNLKWNNERDINCFVKKETEAPDVLKGWMNNINERLPTRW